MTHLRDRDLGLPTIHFSDGLCLVPIRMGGLEFRVLAKFIVSGIYVEQNYLV